MKIWGILGTATLLTGLSTSPSIAFDIEKVDSSVVRIQWIARNTRTGKLMLAGHGTGFVVAEGYVVTNDHVAIKSKKWPDFISNPGLYIPDGSWRKRHRVTVIWNSKALDLAVLHVPTLKRPSVVLSSAGRGGAGKKGTKVYAVGFPGASDRTMRGAGMLESTTTDGVVGKIAKASGPGGKLRSVIQHNAEINPGNSGGPLFNNCHHVVGVNTFVAASRFKIGKDRSGKSVAGGVAVTGHYYSPHVTNLLQAFKTVPALARIPLRTTSDVCKVSAGGMPAYVYILIAVLFVLAASALMVALFRKGGKTREIIKVVESYSSWVRRKGDGPKSASRSSGAGGAPATIAPGKPRTRAPAAGADSNEIPTKSDEGWILSGFDGDGNVVRLTIGKEELRQAMQGPDGGLVIGRSKSQARKIVGDGSVSRKHALAIEKDGGLAISDLESAYGTTVDGKKLEPNIPEPVAAGGKVELGEVTLEVSTS